MNCGTESPYAKASMAFIEMCPPILLPPVGASGLLKWTPRKRLIVRVHRLHTLCMREIGFTPSRCSFACHQKDAGIAFIVACRGRCESWWVS